MEIFIENSWENFDKNLLIKDGNKFYYKNIKLNLRKNQIRYNCDICGREIKSLVTNLSFQHCKFCRAKETMKNRYGVENSWQLPEVKEKIKQKSIERYGVDHPMKSPEIINKLKKSFREKYGVDNPNKLDSIKEKVKKTQIKNNGFYAFNMPRQKQTNIEKYGGPSPSCSENVRNKQKKTMLDKYGYKSNLSNLELKKEGMLKKYGVDNPLKSDEIKEKIKKTNLERYGYECPTKSRIVADKIKKSRLLDTYDRWFKSNNLQIEPNFEREDFALKNSKYYEFSWKCKKCGCIFNYSFTNGTIPRCPTCYPKLSGASFIEKEIVDWLKSLNLNLEENTRKIISPLELDIYISSHNLAIEFDGLYWHSELQGGKDSNYHLDKTTKCKELGIQLLHIWEDEWIEKQNIVKSIIKSKLGLYDRAIGARQCNIKEVSNQEASDFYFDNHIQSSINSKVNIGLFYQNKLVSCLSFSKPRYNKHYQWEITRFASLLNTTVYGSFSKLWTYFQKVYKPESLITYSDKRYFDGSVYKKYFTELEDSGPAYWYIKDGQLYNRIEFQKHRLKSKLSIYDPELTEWENMQINGYDRIWDCGNKVFVWSLNALDLAKSKAFI